MTIIHQVVNNKNPAPTGNAGIAAQLSGLVAQASSLANSGTGLPGLNNIGTYISSLAAGLTGSAASLATQISALGSQMSSGGQSGMSAIVSQLTSWPSQLSGLLNIGSLSQVLHSHVIDKMKGIKASAFQGQHTTTWDQNGVTHQSSAAVTSTAPNIPHNGNTQVSDNLNVTKIVTASAYD